MELSKRIARWRYVYGWRWRHFILDTRAGHITQLCIYITLLLAGVVQTTLAIIAVMQPTSGVLHAAVDPFLIYLIIVIIIAILIVAFMPRPHAPPTADQEVKSPTTQDGRSAIRWYGTNWFDAPAMLAWKVVGKDPIFSKGGGK